MILRTLLLLTIASLTACSYMPRDNSPDMDYSPTIVREQTPALPGTIFRGEGGLPLFADRRARVPGDILTIILVERTDASKNSGTSTSKSTSIDTGNPIIAGRPVTVNGTEVLNNEIGIENEFEGSANASQQNSLNGSIAVTVSERLPNGNLLIKGEKLITLNQGQEFIRFSGIVRPVDIDFENTVPSTKVADARIVYSEDGILAHANEPGWLAKFFNSPWMPF